MQSKASTIVILGTGGTIAGTAASAADHVGYTAAQLGVEQLLAAIPALAAEALEAEQVAQVDSKDMNHAIWQKLAQRVEHHLARPEVAGIVITHGTDTLEESAYFLHRVLAPAKPVALTAAMRPATALMADGPQNLFDAVRVVRSPGVRGVLALLGGAVYHGAEVRKSHSYRLDAFDAGDAGPLAFVEDGALRCLRDWPQGEPLGLQRIQRPPHEWPVVEIVTSHAGASGRVVEALLATGVDGLVVAATGNGTLNAELDEALRNARRRGVRVLRVTRCARGAIVGHATEELPAAGALTPQAARVELLLQLLANS